MHDPSTEPVIDGRLSNLRRKNEELTAEVERLRAEVERQRREIHSLRNQLNDQEIRIRLARCQAEQPEGTNR